MENNTIPLFRVTIKRPCLVYPVKIQHEGKMKYGDGDKYSLVPGDVIEVEEVVAKALKKNGHECRHEFEDDDASPEEVAAAAAEAGVLVIVGKQEATESAEANSGYLIEPGEELKKIYNNRTPKSRPYIWLSKHVVSKDPSLINREASALEENLKNGVYVVFGGEYVAVLPNKDALAAFYQKA